MYVTVLNENPNMIRCCVVHSKLSVLLLHVLQRRDLEEDLTVVCELCSERTINFNKHMKTKHPGCGGMLALRINTQQTCIIRTYTVALTLK